MEETNGLPDYLSVSPTTKSSNKKLIKTLVSAAESYGMAVAHIAYQEGLI